MKGAHRATKPEDDPTTPRVAADMAQLKIFLEHHVGLAFALMGVSCGVFALATFNLAYLFKANLSLFLDYGIMVVGDGALRQLFELIGDGYLGLAAYVLFKVCEHSLVDHFLVRVAKPDFRD
jgi:hypothetical protein